MKPMLSFFAAVSLVAALGTASPAGAQNITSQEMKPVLEQLLRENPEVLLDFLHQHSETLLDIVQEGSDKRRMANMEKQWAEDAKVKKTVAVKDRPRVGKSDAKVQIVAFSDFTCQFCTRAEKTVEELLNEFSGQVSFVFKNMPLEPEGLSGLASQYFVAISLIDENKAWKFYKTLFHEHEKLLLDSEKFLRDTAMAIGVDMKKLDSVRRGKQVKAILDEDLKDSEKLELEGTPCFLVNNLVIRGAVSKEIFRRAIEIELAR